MFCTKCGSTVDDGVKFCPNCGNVMDDKNSFAQNTEQYAHDDPRNPVLQDECMRSLYYHLKHEKLVWKIFGIVAIVSCALLIFGGIVIMVAGIGSAAGSIYAGDEYISFTGASAIASLGGMYFMFYGIFLTPIAVIDLVMIGKTQRYIDSLYTDCGEAVTRCGSVGMIVFAALFNEIALIFIIINFVKVKRYRAVFDEVRKAQLGYN